MSVPEYIERKRMNRIDEFDLRGNPRGLKESELLDYYIKRRSEEIHKISAERREARRKAILSQKRFGDSQDIRSLEKFS